MEHSSTSSNSGHVFPESNLSESEYLQLARAYRNEAAGAVLAKMIKVTSEVIKKKLSFNLQSLLKRA